MQYLSGPLPSYIFGAVGEKHSLCRNSNLPGLKYQELETSWETEHLDHGHTWIAGPALTTFIVDTFRRCLVHFSVTPFCCFRSCSLFYILTTFFTFKLILRDDGEGKTFIASTNHALVQHEDSRPPLYALKQLENKSVRAFFQEISLVPGRLQNWHDVTVWTLKWVPVRFNLFIVSANGFMFLEKLID